MKNLLKLLGVVLVAAFFLVSCNIEKGGTIEVTNGLSVATNVVVVKGIDLIGAGAELTAGNGTVLQSGEMKSFHKDEDGVYTVYATTTLLPFSDTVTLSLGNTKKVTIK